MGFSEATARTTKSSDNVRYTSDFLKVTDEHRTIIRVLDDTPVTAWSHFVKGNKTFPMANKGKGISIICPGMDICPICIWNKTQEAKDQLKSRKVFAFNVLDRTPVITCPTCGVEHYDKIGTSYSPICECGADISKVKPAARNKVQIFQKGVRVTEQISTFEEEYGNVTKYDIKLDTKGKLQEATTVLVPKQESKLDFVVEKDSMFDIETSLKPLRPDQIKRILDGEGYFDVAKE